jgi:hypothetical protein
MTTYTWTIPTVERNLTDGGVTVAHWRCDAVDGDYSASSYGTVGFTPDATAEGFVPYENLTEADVLAWVHGSVDKDATEAALAAKIDAEKNPTTTAGTPW